MFGRKIRQNLPMRGGILLASTEVVCRPRLTFSLHCDMNNLWQIRTEKSNACALCLRPTDLLECWPYVCRVMITFTLLLPTNCFVCATTNSMRYLVHWIPVGICVGSRNTPRYEVATISRLLKIISLFGEYTSLL